MLNKKILKMLDGNDILIQKNHYGCTVYNIGFNADKYDENDRLNPNALESTAYSLMESEMKDLEEICCQVIESVSRTSSINVEIYQGDLLEYALKQYEKYPEELDEALLKLGYVKKEK